MRAWRVPWSVSCQPRALGVGRVEGFVAAADDARRADAARGHRGVRLEVLEAPEPLDDRLVDHLEVEDLEGLDLERDARPHERGRRAHRGRERDVRVAQQDVPRRAVEQPHPVARAGVDEEAEGVGPERQRRAVVGPRGHQTDAWIEALLGLRRAARRDRHHRSEDPDRQRVSA